MTDGSNGTQEPDAPAHVWTSVPVRMAAFLTACYVGWHLLTPRLPPLGPVTGTLLSVTASVTLSIGIIYHVARVATALRGEIAGAVVCLGIWAVILYVLRPADDQRLVAAVTSHTFFLFGATFAGKALTRAVGNVNLLLPIAVVAVVFDTVYVFWGPTGHMVEVMPQVVAHLSMPIPAVGGSEASGPVSKGYVATTLGPGDLLFVAFLLAAALRLKLNARGTYLSMVPLVIAGLLFVVATGKSLPGWLVFTPGFIAANYHYFHYTAQEKRAMLQAGAVLAVIVALTIIAFHGQQ